MGIDSLWETASSSHLRNCNFCHFHIGFMFQPWKLPLGCSSLLVAKQEQKCKNDVLFQTKKKKETKGVQSTDSTR